MVAVAKKTAGAAVAKKTAGAAVAKKTASAAVAKKTAGAAVTKKTASASASSKKAGAAVTKKTASASADGKPVVLIILDGVGLNPSPVDNGFALARTPNIDQLLSCWPATELEASAEAVGLPPEQMGNSEVGHLTLGCGAVPLQDRVRLDRSIDSGDFFTNPTLVRALAEVRDAGRPLHLLGLVSDGGVHSHEDHLLAALQLCRREGVRPLVPHDH